MRPQWETVNNSFVVVEQLRLEKGRNVSALDHSYIDGRDEIV
jgi:hypothetical protein